MWKKINKSNVALSLTCIFFFIIFHPQGIGKHPKLLLTVRRWLKEECVLLQLLPHPRN